VCLADGRLAKRPGFSEWEADVTGSADAVLFLGVAHFRDGTVYVMAKCDDGKMYQRQAYPTDAGSFTEVPTEQTLDSTNPGWSFHYADRWHYFDSGGGTRWHPDNLSTDSKAYKAGAPAPSTGPTCTQAAGGQKDGYYHAVYAWWNSTTREEGQVSPPKAPYVNCVIPDNKGGIAVAVGTPPSAYEVDEAVVYCSRGNTELLQREDTSVELFSYRYYKDAIGTTPVGLNKADDVLDPETQFTNQGGEPRGSLCGTWTGRYGIYGRIYESSTEKDTIEFSKPGFATMIPRPVLYSASNNQGCTDKRTIDARPWNGQIVSPCVGGVSEIVSAAGLVGVYTPTRTYQLRIANDGTLAPILWIDGIGSVGRGGACSTGTQLHAIGYRAWTMMTAQKWVNLAQDQWTTLMAEIPAAQQHRSRMAYYSWNNEVWCAVVKSEETVAQRILVLSLADNPRGEMAVYEPSCLASDEGISWMVELASPGADPAMLVATTAGRILKLGPSSQIVDAGTDFEATWRGSFGMERAQYSQRVVGIEVFAGSHCAGHVGWRFRPKRTSEHRPAQRTGRLRRDDAINTFGALGKVDGRLFEIEFNSAAESTVADAVTWDIEHLVIKVDRTDKK